jgi:hypothetical protein
MLIVTPSSDQRGNRSYAVWEYDTSRPRNPSAADPRARYAAKGIIGVFSSLSAAQGMSTRQGEDAASG